MLSFLNNNHDDSSNNEARMEPLRMEGPAAREEEADARDNDEQDDEDSSSGSDDDSSTEGIPMPRVLGPLDEGRMALGATERLWAREIKAAAAKCPELEPLSDFWYAQVAIVSFHEHHQNLVAARSDLPAVLERLHALQDMRQEYFIRDTVSHGVEVMSRTVCDLLPGWFMAFSYHAEKGAYLRVVSLTEFNMSIFTQNEKVRTWLAAIWYINHAHVPDMEAARQGFVQYVECKGYEWRNQSMFHIKAFSEAAPLFALYPLLCQQTVHYNTGMFVKLLASMAKRLLPKHLTKDFLFESGSIGEGVTRLEELFAMPTQEVANQRLVARLKDALERRYQNEANFRL
ncbi:expressed unknown protein [Seminavis robusta]|uniref:Uncharacterized protein n=1 Tax=Seminavis robusta TaxID=568900 RepID=A0A9N8HP30_9STRA|nr:expressed unknown protein [Seminavis robusta]|eukprot:Sro1283_g259110.1 n/a (344) ;mRNA; f:13457-14488